MELPERFFHAASNGDVHGLKNFLLLKCQSEIKTLVSTFTDGATPLIMACNYGHLDVVLLLIETCHADIEQVGSIVDSETDERVEGVSPLWCAAVAGHLSIVQALIKYKATVDATSQMNINTPLFSACSRGHYRIVAFLIKKSADVNIKCGCGYTALHECSFRGHLELTKLLLNHGAKFVRNSAGFTPLLLAASFGHASIVDLFIKRVKLTKLQVIKATELLGAGLVDFKSKFVVGIYYWKTVMELRYEDSERTIEEVLTSISPFRREVRTVDQLNDLISNDEEMRIQALLVRERIFGPSDISTLCHIQYVGRWIDYRGNFQQCIRLGIHVLDLMQQKPSKYILCMKVDILQEIFIQYSDMMSNDLDIVFQDVLRVFKKSMTDVETVSKWKDSHEYSFILVMTVRLLGLMCHLKLNEGEETLLLKTAYEFVQLNIKKYFGVTLLHLACGNLLHDNIAAAVDNTVFSFPSVKLVNLLLEVGALPNATTTGNKDTSLHVVARIHPRPVKIIRMLLKYGAHLDCMNLEKETPLQLLHDTPSFDISYLKYLNLQCLCAQVINNHGIRYVGKVGKNLKAFLDVHCN